MCLLVNPNISKFYISGENIPFSHLGERKDRTMSNHLGPKDILHKPVVDAYGVPVGRVINITQNGSGNFDIFGVQVDRATSAKMNHGHAPADGPIFLDIDIIETVDRVVRLKKRIEELLADEAH